MITIKNAQRKAYTHIFTPERSGERIDTFLARSTEHSRSYCQTLIRSGFVIEAKSKEPITHCSYKTIEGEAIIMHEPPPTPTSMQAEPLPLEVIYEDDDIIVVNKPAGMVVHPSAGHATGTLANALLHHCEGSLSGINGTMKPGIVHRIDRFTSGLLVAAKNDHAHHHIANQIALRSMQRHYIALCQGYFAPRHLRVDAPIGRSTINRLCMSIRPSGRSAQTSFQNILATQGSSVGTSSLLICKLHTGRTHQVRVHASFKRFPLLNDITYGGRDISHIDLVEKGRQMLHAFHISLKLPSTDQIVSFKTQPPKDMQAVYREVIAGKALFQCSQPHAQEIFQS